jgi:long-chain acyl-CoA synthetase
MINRAGYKVYSAEVEDVLAHHPQVGEAAVVAEPDPVLGEKTHAFVLVKRAR